MGISWKIQEEGVLEIRLAMNEKNTFSEEFMRSFMNILEDPAARNEARAVLFAGDVKGYFSNGPDPYLFLDKSREDVYRVAGLLLDAARAVLSFPAPMVALLNGHCMGAGSVFAVCADYRFMLERGARIGFPEASIGMNFPAAVAAVLRDQVGGRKARELLYEARLLKGPEAREIGLVDEIAPEEVLEERARAKARSLAGLPRTSGRGIRRALMEDYLRLLEERRLFDQESMTETVLTPEAQEGFRALAENRRPRF